ncbi:P-loop containing nucleoside triphosphate hydrolase protein [Artomyces pyxidatus]|uniref:P-loop containing nucleoside triphosphate hydrolase protein n=1 Tax=Artomyces pyxidatus TaxID=48021 RepID=A0ACB8SXR4_9AGAM|nr:P-loop containing nucleoside triphosphate hydrolase protein [Artomyces pyxidatus]
MMSNTLASPELGLDHRVVLILVGLVASGKSTFAEALERHFPHFQRCNQDELGDRRAVENRARRCLQQGLSVCIDRTNLDESQRAHWINIARDFPGTAVWVIVFDTPYQVCAERLQTRRHHPTIKDAETGLRVLSRFASTCEPPAPREGYHRIVTITPAQQPSADYTRADVLAIVHRVRDSPQVDSAAQPRIEQFFRGGGGGSHAPGRGGSTGLRGHASWGYGSSSQWASRGMPSGRGRASGSVYRGGYPLGRGAYTHRGSPETRGALQGRRGTSHQARWRRDDDDSRPSLEVPNSGGTSTTGPAGDPVV